MASLNQDTDSITYGQMNLSNNLSKLWLQLAMWTREYILNYVSGFGDLNAAGSRLYHVPTDFKNAFELFFGTEIAQRIERLLTNHVVLISEIVKAQKEGDTEAVDKSITSLYQNSDEIASFLAHINPYWNEQVWKSLLYEYNRATSDEIIAVLAGGYGASIIIYENIEDQVSRMADYMARGFSQYFIP